METQDIVQEFANTQQIQQDSSLNGDILQQYADSLKSSVEENQVEEVIQQPETIVEETITDSIPDGHIENDTISNSISDDAEEDEIVDEDDFIQQLTGGKFSNREQLEEALQSEKQISFENETSAAIYNMLAEGDINGVYNILQKKMIADEVSKKSEPEILKAYIKYNNPEFDDSDVEDEYNEKYTIDEFAYDDSKLRREEKKLTQRIKADVQNAKEFFKNFSEEVQLPKYTPTQVEQANDEDDALVQEYRQQYLNSLTEAQNRVTSLPLSWKDEKGNISVDGKFDIPVQELSSYRDGAENLNDYLATKYYQGGKYQADRLLRDLYVADNFEKIVSSFVSQAVTQTRLSILKNSKNITFDEQPSSTFKPSSAEEERAMFDKLFNGHLAQKQY